MPAKRELTMRQLRQMLRLHHDGMRTREIARSLGAARSTIQDNSQARRRRAWLAVAGRPDGASRTRLFTHAGVSWFAARLSRIGRLARELKRPGVTMMILWEEYREAQPEGYGYSRFCDLFRDFERRLSPVMRQHHVAGDKAFVDYSGKRIGIADAATGEIRAAEIFVAVLGASNFTYAEATWTQTLSDWTGAHVRMFRFFGGVSRLLVPDNLKSGVNKASFYDPEINRSYGAMAAHYSVGVLPARPQRPRDKAKVEAGREIRPDLHSRPAAQSDLLLARRMQRGDQGGARSHERSSDAQARRQPTRVVREDREAGSRLAGRRLGIRGMASRARQSRLSHRGRWLLLFGPACAHPRRGRRAYHGANDRDVPSRPARRRASAPLGGPPARHGSRSYAQRAPALRRMDAGSLPPLGRQDRAEHGRA